MAAVNARPPSDGSGRGLPALQPPRTSPALVQVVDPEAAHIAGEVVGVARLVPAREPGAPVLPPHEARGALRREGERGAVATVQRSVPVGGRLVPPGGPSLLALVSACSRSDRRRESVDGGLGLLPLFLADVGVGGLPSGRRRCRVGAAAGGAPRSRALVSATRLPGVALQCARRAPAPAAAAVIDVQPATPNAGPLSLAARGEVLGGIVRLPLRGRVGTLARGVPGPGGAEPGVVPSAAGPAAPSGTARVLPARRAGRRRSA